MENAGESKKINVELTYNINQKLSFETSQHESYDDFLREAQIECYKKIVEENAKQETANNLIPFGYLIDDNIFNRNNYPRKSWKFTFDPNQGTEISNHLAIFNWYIIKSFDHLDYREEILANTPKIQDMPNQLLSSIFDNQILTEHQINWLLNQSTFCSSFLIINTLGNQENSPSRNEKIYALSALTYELNKSHQKIQYKSPSEIEKKLFLTYYPIQSQEEKDLLSSNITSSVPPKSITSSDEPPKRKIIWPKALLIALGIILISSTVALGFFTGGIGLTFLAGIGAIGKAIAVYIAAHTITCSIITAVSGSIALSITAAASIKLHRDKNYNKNIDEIEQGLKNGVPFINHNQPAITHDKKDRENFRPNINSAPGKADDFNSQFSQQSNNEENSKDPNNIKTPLFPGE